MDPPKKTTVAVVFVMFFCNGCARSSVSAIFSCRRGSLRSLDPSRDVSMAYRARAVGGACVCWGWFCCCYPGIYHCITGFRFFIHMRRARESCFFSFLLLCHYPVILAKFKKRYTASSRRGTRRARRASRSRDSTPAATESLGRTCTPSSSASTPRSPCCTGT